MSFNDSSSHMDNILGMLHGESSTIPPSHGKASAVMIFAVFQHFFA